MARPKVFISSTCYDLGSVRAELRRFVEGLGFEAVLSEHGDVLFDARQHTHLSCISEVANCDIVVVLIGGRFGGEAVDDALKSIDASLLEELRQAWDKGKIDDASVGSGGGMQEKFSITQLEVVRAIQLQIPLFVLADRDVLHEQLIYDKNGGQKCVAGASSGGGIVFPSIDKQETACYIFEFIKYIRGRATNNGVFPFSTIQDIEDYLRKQWAAHFQRLLAEQRSDATDQRVLVDISEQLDGLRAAFLSAVNDDKKEVASVVIRYRTILEVAYSLVRDSLPALADKGASWKELLSAAEVASVRGVKAAYNQRGLVDRMVLILGDDTFWRSKYGANTWSSLEGEWVEFLTNEQGVRKSAAEAVVADKPEARMLSRDQRKWSEVFDDDDLSPAEGIVDVGDD